MKEFIVKKVEKKFYVQYTCRIEEHLLDLLKEISVENNLSVNYLVNECIRFALENSNIEDSCT